jgi:hypothetical protein
LQSNALGALNHDFSHPRIMSRKKHNEEKTLHNFEEKLHNSHKPDLTWQETTGKIT